MVQVNVLIIQSVIKQYQVPFFELLHASLTKEGATLRVVYSQPNSVEARKKDNAELPLHIGGRVPGRWFAGDKIIVQNVVEHVRWADLVIVEQANKHLVNYALMLASALRLKPLAFWGHGRNRQGDPRSFGERTKRTLVRACDWWFAYTKQTAHYVASCGMPVDRITIVQNSTDTRRFREQIAAVRPADVASFAAEHGILDGGIVGLYCGALYVQKCLPFLLESAREIRRQIPNFQLVIAGDGPDRAFVEAAVAEHHWMRSVGPVFNERKALCFAMADIFLCPGLVGLAILDAFAAELPLLTTDIPVHSPEIEYLDHNRNGLLTPHTVEAYSAAVVRLLQDNCEFQRIRAGTIASAEKYTIERMVANFSAGILAFAESRFS